MAHRKASVKLQSLTKMVSIIVGSIPTHTAVDPKALTAMMQFDSSQMMSDMYPL